MRSPEGCGQQGHRESGLDEIEYSHLSTSKLDNQESMCGGTYMEVRSEGTGSPRLGSLIFGSRTLRLEFGQYLDSQI